MNWKYNHPLQNFFTWALLLFAITGLVVLFSFSKEDCFWILNHQHSDEGDFFLKYFTHAGDGLFMLGLAVVLIGLGKRKLGLLLILSFLLSGLLVQAIKRINPQPRPGLYFNKPSVVKKADAIHYVDGKLLTGRNSFPSGHTTTAFALFSLLAFASRNKLVQSLCFAAAILVGYSRIYLGQHFFNDVLAGAVLGYISSLFLYWLLRNKEMDV